jgi:hypothetical protein
MEENILYLITIEDKGQMRWKRGITCDLVSTLSLRGMPAGTGLQQTPEKFPGDAFSRATGIKRVRI